MGLEDAGRTAAYPQYRREVDDRAAGAEMRQCGAAHEEDRPDVGGHQLVPRFVGALVDRPVTQAASADADDVHDHLEAAEPVDGGGYRRVDGVRVGDVAADHVGRLAGRRRRDR